MKHTFTLGAVSGVTALAIGFPIAAQFAGAQSSADTGSAMTDRPGMQQRAPLSQDDVQEMVDRDNAILLHVDDYVSIVKGAVQNHRIALQAAADIEDETERNDAVRAANEAMRTEIHDAVEADADLKDAMPMGMMMGMGGRGPGGPGGPGGKGPHGFPPEMLAEKLGMTADELKAELDAGKTIQQIAEEKGVDLPAPPMGMGDRHGKLAELLGMTEDELQAALDSGKTPEDLAQEKGITLPARPAFGGPRR